MEYIIPFISLCVTFGFLMYVMFEWLDKIELEKKYLKNLLDEQERSKYTIKKGIM